MELRFSALRVEQRHDTPLYVFGVEGQVVHRFATVDQAARTADGTLVGYQRERVASHIRQIASYLAQEDALLPNAIVIAFDHGLAFRPLPGSINSRWGTPGDLSIAVPGSGQPKPGLIVDGQQRVSAFSLLPNSRKFPVIVVAFVASSPEVQREQFVLVNKTRPLPRALLSELLPSVDTHLPPAWQRRRIAGAVAEVLRFDKASPFYGRVRGIGSSAEGCNISLAALLEVVDRSARARGVLATRLGAGDADIAEAARIVSVFFSAVARVWPEAWAGSPWTSRLVHGVGIAALGRLMDHVMLDVDHERPRAIASAERRLRPIAGRCAWTEGYWPSPLGCPWNALQNTVQDKRRLGEYLVSLYEA